MLVKYNGMIYETEGGDPAPTVPLSERFLSLLKKLLGKTGAYKD